MSQVLVLLLLSFVIITNAGGSPKSWPKVTIDSNDYKVNDDLRSLYEIKNGQDPCSIPRTKKPPLDVNFTELHREFKCTAAINAFESLGAKSQGPCQNFMRKGEEYATSDEWMDECIYRKGSTRGFCGVQVMVEYPSCVSFCHALHTLEWVSLEKCIEHLEFTNFDTDIARATVKNEPIFTVNSKDYPTGVAKEQMQQLFEVKTDQDPCKPLRSQKNAHKGVTHLEQSQIAKCTAAIDAFESLPVNSQGLCKHFKRSYGKYRPTDGRFNECVYGEDTVDGYCGILRHVRKPGNFPGDSSQWSLESFPLERCLKHSAFYNFKKAPITVTANNQKVWPKITIKVNDYGAVGRPLDKIDVRRLITIQNDRRDVCAPLVSDKDVLPSMAITYAVQTKAFECNGAIRAFRRLGTESHGPCKNFGSKSDTQSPLPNECMYGHGDIPGYCAVQILTKKHYSADGLLQLRLEWIPLRDCLDHILIHWT